TVALFAYEQSILVPAALLLPAYFQRESVKKRAMLRYIGLLAIVDVVYIIIRKLVTSEIVGTYEGGNVIRMNLGVLAANFFRILFRLILNPATKTTFIISSVVLVLITGVILLSTKTLHVNKRAISFFAAIIVLLVAPVISLGLAVNSFESGRYLYLPSIFFITGISIGCSFMLKDKNRLRAIPLIFIIIAAIYWVKGKAGAARYYADASLYSKKIELKIQQHFKNSSDTLYLDTLHVTIHRLPVFRRGFKTGINWLNGKIDTNKVVIKNYYDEVVHRELE
ncbi:MAG: hypothetical protein M3040_13385, partial [Bacteroidota bacterium]|nr:hypothetical protein [Bacteroidota bacterium]